MSSHLYNSQLLWVPASILLGGVQVKSFQHIIFVVTIVCINSILNQRTAVLLLLTATFLLQIFHVLVLAGVIPFHVVGGGRIKTRQDMYVLESIALGTNFLFIFILMIKGKFIPEYLSLRHVNWLLKIFAFFFLLNALGNLFSTSIYEKVIFVPRTLIFAALIFFILRHRQETK